jgi:hypothetical protein
MKNGENAEANQLIKILINKKSMNKCLEKGSLTLENRLQP